MKNGEIEPPGSARSSLPGVSLHFEQSTVPLLLGSSNTAELQRVHVNIQKTLGLFFPFEFLTIAKMQLCLSITFSWSSSPTWAAEMAQMGREWQGNVPCVWEEGCLLLVYLFWGEIKCFVWRLFAREPGPCKSTAKFVSGGERNLGRLP